jgi:hypothetical protein
MVKNPFEWVCFVLLSVIFRYIMTVDKKDIDVCEHERT